MIIGAVGFVFALIAGDVFSANLTFGFYHLLSIIGLFALIIFLFEKSRTALFRAELTAVLDDTDTIDDRMLI